MALCPVMSRKGNQVECYQKKCEWWAEIDGRGGCAILLIPVRIDSLRLGLDAIAKAASK